MANLIEVTDTTKIKPLDGALVRRYNAGAAVVAGYPVYLNSSGAIVTASGSSAPRRIASSGSRCVRWHPATAATWWSRGRCTASRARRRAACC